MFEEVALLEFAEWIVAWADHALGVDDAPPGHVFTTSASHRVAHHARRGGSSNAGNLAVGGHFARWYFFGYAIDTGVDRV